MTYEAKSSAAIIGNRDEGFGDSDLSPFFAFFCTVFFVKQPWRLGYAFFSWVLVAVLVPPCSSVPGEQRNFYIMACRKN